MRSLENVSPSILDAAILSGLRELELLAKFYAQRGNSSQADEILEAVATMREQLSRHPGGNAGSTGIHPDDNAPKNFV